MRLSKHYSKFNKLLKLNCFRGTLTYAKRLNFKIFYFNQTFTYQTTYSFFLFLYKIKTIFKSIIKKKGHMCLLFNREVSFNAFFKKHSETFEIPCLDLCPQILSNTYFFKNLVVNPNYSFLTSLHFFHFISFFIIFLKGNRLSDKQKVTYIANKKIPFLIFSKHCFVNSYSINISYCRDKQNFWFFLVMSMLFESTV